MKIRLHGMTGIYLIEQNWKGRGNIEAVTWRDRDNSQKLEQCGIPV